MPKKDRNDARILLKLSSLRYAYPWDEYASVDSVKTILSHASKRMTGKQGAPDQIYENPEKQLLILVENKPRINQHISEDGVSEPEKYAVDGIRHYLSCFTRGFLKGLGCSSAKTEAALDELQHWKIVGVAVSGDINDEYNQRIDTLIIQDGTITHQSGISELLNESDYLSLFENIDEEATIAQISRSSRKINQLLRTIDSQKRPTLLSALMICLFETKHQPNDFRNNYSSWSASTIVAQMPITVASVLKEESIPSEKVDVILTELSWVKVDNDLCDNNQHILKDILVELSSTVIPLFSRKSSYDIIGKFYEEFLRFAGIANVKKGIVLTPKHISALFTELIDMKYDDVIVDFCCGTGAFLIAGMNALTDIIEKSELPNKQTRIESIKSNQLIGFEKNQMMYTLAISNMMFRGDGKSNIVYGDCFSTEADQKLYELSHPQNRDDKVIVPTIGFMNPPYGGGDNDKNPTKKEIQFLARMLDSVTRYGVIIAPLSTFIQDKTLRESILKKHTLKTVINMPRELFMPNASAETAIAVFETNRPHGDTETVFYDLKDDGFILSKSKGRTDLFNRWPSIKNDMLHRLANPETYADRITLTKKSIRPTDEWLIQAHSEVDYGKLTTLSFVNSIKDFMVFDIRRSLKLLDRSINALTFAELLHDFYGLTGEELEGFAPKALPVDTWVNCNLIDYFDAQTGKYYPATSYASGDVPLISASDKDNGVMTQTDLAPLFQAPSLTIGKVDMSVFYQDSPFCMTCDATALIPRFEPFGTLAGLFLKTVLEQERYKWCYGRQIRLNNCKRLSCKLPVLRTQDGMVATAPSAYDPRKEVPVIDWAYIDAFMESLPYANKIGCGA